MGPRRARRIFDELAIGIICWPALFYVLLNAASWLRHGEWL